MSVLPPARAGIDQDRQRLSPINMAEDQYAVVVIRLVGGPADGFVLRVPVNAVPKFFVSRYEPEPGNGDVRVYRHMVFH